MIIYAVGDAAASGGLPLTPVAIYEGGIVATNLLGGNHITPNYKGIPSVVFTIPPLSSVGLQEEAQENRVCVLGLIKQIRLVSILLGV